MNLFIVIYIAGQIGGTVGPLPYGMEECQLRAATQWSKGDPNIVTPQGYTMQDIRLTCGWHEVRPGNDPDAARPRS